MSYHFTMSRVMDATKELLFSLAFKERHRMSETDFSRNRKLGFAEVSTIILKGAKRGLHTAVKEASESIRCDVDSYSEAAFCKARRKINYTAFEELCQVSAKEFYCAATEAKRYQGFRVWAIDGSKINLPTNPATLEEFDSEPFKCGSRAQSLASCLYDVLNAVVLDAAMERVDANERELASRHIAALGKYCEEAGIDKKNELITLDRGYPSEELISQIMSAGFRFVARANKDNFWKEVSGVDTEDAIIQRGTMQLRVVRVKLAQPEQTVSGKTETMATFLTNLTEEEFSVEDISNLYRLRWKIETNYGFLKSRIELENFTGLTPLCLRQDFYAALYLSNLIACMKYDTAADAAQYSRDKKYEYKLNYTEAYRELRKDIFDLVLCDSRSSFYYAYRKLRKRICETLIPIRDNRHPKRGRPRTGARFFHNHKPS